MAWMMVFLSVVAQEREFGWSYDEVLDRSLRFWRNSGEPVTYQYSRYHELKRQHCQNLDFSQLLSTY